MPHSAPDESIGEIDLIAEFFAPLAASTPSALGLTDDAACLTLTPHRDLVITSDMLVAGVHFFTDDDPGDIAWKALAVNLSDLAAKGAHPLIYTLAIAFPSKPRRSWLAAFALGLREVQSRYRIGLAGGDTTATPGPLTISITAIGETPTGSMPRRSGAKAGDLIYMTGTLGDAALGLKLRSREASAADWGLSEDAAAYLVGRYLRPLPRVEFATSVRQSCRASMDISDGFLLDLSRLCTASGVGARVECAAIPLSPAAREALQATPSLLPAILTGGDDYEILAAVSPEAEAAFVARAAGADHGATKIGVITEGEGVAVIDFDGAPLQISARGYEHFA